MLGSQLHIITTSSPLPVLDLANHQALIDQAASPRAVFVFAHGAGADMQHRFMTDLAAALRDIGVTVVRFNFPYMAHQRPYPDKAPVCEASVCAVAGQARQKFPGLPLVVGGKSMGGRMSTQAIAHGALDADGVILFGFPLHPARQPAATRAAHLAEVAPPMLFVRGSKDALAERALFDRHIASLPQATVVHIDDADHGFDMPKRAGKDGLAIAKLLASHVDQWLVARGW